jgi:hypothetical protein
VSTATTIPTHAHRPVFVFLRHLGEMTLAMFVGMFSFGFALGLIAGANGSSLESVRTTQPELFMAGMFSAMSTTMVVWMRRRNHSWRDAAEMTGAMLVPVLGMLGCYWAGAVTATSVCPISCALMVPAMAGAMWFRRDHYATHQRGPDGRRLEK